jgi:hypothetical protein
VLEKFEDKSKMFKYLVYRFKNNYLKITYDGEIFELLDRDVMTISLDTVEHLIKDMEAHNET